MPFVSVFVKDIQNKLIQEVYDDLRYYVQVLWANNRGSIHVYVRKHRLMEHILQLASYHTEYNKKEYKIKSIRVKEKINRNPHIKIEKYVPYNKKK
jgi:hypothetical protein